MMSSCLCLETNVCQLTVIIFLECVLLEYVLSRLSVSVNRRNFYTGCVGFALGGMIGVVVGMSLQSQPSPSQRIRAVICMDYRGLDVS